MSLTPLIYVDHGSPMRILEDYPMNEKLEKLGLELKDNIKSVLIVSAHFMKNANYITSGDRLKTIYDFYGFPDELYEIIYEPKVDKSLVDKLSNILLDVVKTSDWGLDHGAWSVLKKLFPEADIPVVELSINTRIGLNDYYEIGNKLSKLRQEGVLIIGSGSIVHNLREIDYDKNVVYKRAQDFDNYVKEYIMKGEYEKLINYHMIPNNDRAFYTSEHYIPLLYVLGATQSGEKATYLNSGITNGSLSNNLIFIE